MNGIGQAIKERILVLDGAMGTMIQKYGLTEADFRRGLDADPSVRLTGNNDLLNLTRPDVISEIHRKYLEAGADIIETNTFNAQRISQTEYRTAHLVGKINSAAVRIARKEADRMTELTPGKPRFVAGSIGPTGKTASMSPDVENPAFRAVDFDTLVEAYSEQMDALVRGGADLLLVETIFDTLNAKAALEAARRVFAALGKSIPVSLSMTVADASGRTLSGQTIEAFLTSVAHAAPFSVGLNCSFGAGDMLPFLKELASESPFPVSAYPNAGIPDSLGHYDQTPEMMAESTRDFIENGLVNIIGGCCGSTPGHIAAISSVVSEYSGRPVRKPGKQLRSFLSGLDAFRCNGSFINIGERCNVAGSRKFLRLIKEKSYGEALAIARSQVRDGAMIIDINMDDAMLAGKEEMVNFLNLMASDPEVARIPWMVDSSRFDVIEAALKTIQGKAIVNSISLKEGEEIFLQRASRIRELGAAAVIMAFDEEGQATTFERKKEICARAYRLLTERLHFPPEDIIFDPNVLTIATGIKEHDSYGLDFIRAVEWIHKNLPYARTSGGVSNLSFSFRGNNYLREAMHAVFLYHAAKAGLDMAIVNPASSVMYRDIPQELAEALEDVILNKREDATERLLSVADKYRESAVSAGSKAPEAARNTISVEDRLVSALEHGEEEFLEADLHEALAAYGSAAKIIEGPLMKGMASVGELFGAGKMFLPQVVKSARTMKRAVEILMPHIKGGADSGAGVSGKKTAGRYVLATVKGDVHDIGKNIVSVILSCNNFEVIDLGVMVTAEQIIKAVKEHDADFIGLSGLITPSLEEMCRIASELKAAGIDKPLFIGGATTSDLHTAVKIAPLYGGAVFHVKDAAQNPVLAMQLSGDKRDEIIAGLKAGQEELRKRFYASDAGSDAAPSGDSVSSGKAAGPGMEIDWDRKKICIPSFTGIRKIDYIPIKDIRKYINWIYFYHLWKVRPGTPEAESARQEAEKLIDRISGTYHLEASLGFYKACGLPEENAVIAERPDGIPDTGTFPVRIPAARQKKPGDIGKCLSLSDFVAPKGYGDYIGAFAVTVCRAFSEEMERLKKAGEQYDLLMMQSVGDRLVEAASEWLHLKVRRELWGYASDENLTDEEIMHGKYRGIRPAVGYPSLPEQKAIFQLAALVDFGSVGITLTENGAMYPQSSVCGLYIADEHSRYFTI